MSNTLLVNPDNMDREEAIQLVKDLYSGRPTKYKIAPEDIGKRWITLGGKSYTLAEVIGYVQGLDVGKTLYLVDNKLSMRGE